MLNSMPVFFAVLRSASSSSVRTSGESASARPMTLKRMLLRSSVSSSRPRYRFSSIISVLTSAAGRFQFSTEKA